MIQSQSATGYSSASWGVGGGGPRPPPDRVDEHVQASQRAHDVSDGALGVAFGGRVRRDRHRLGAGAFGRGARLQEPLLRASDDGDLRAHGRERLAESNADPSGPAGDQSDPIVQPETAQLVHASSLPLAASRTASTIFA
jgi:hypothetical protein